MEAVCSNLDHLGSLLKDFVRGQAHIEASLLFFFLSKCAALFLSTKQHYVTLFALPKPPAPVLWESDINLFQFSDSRGKKKKKSEILE